MVEDDPFINILLLGETGVGKSTFINSIINYLVYGEFKNVEKEDLIIQIPLKITIQDKHGKPQVIQSGEDQNECLETGMSATQNVKSYILPVRDAGPKIRLIDTPGIGDVRGIDQDNINCENILSYIEELDKLHAICYLFKPTHSRFTVYFQYCLSQILSRLEKSASNNIIFIFTSTRGTHYSPGDTFPNLEKIVEDIKSKHGVDIPLQKNLFCFDNEGLRYLVSTKKGVQFDDVIRKRNRESWDRSVEQCDNLIRYITGDITNQPLEPYFIKNASTVNGVRRLIVQFSKLLSETSQTISDNVCTLQRYKDDLDLESRRLNELKETLYIAVTNVDKIKVNQPIMVCASKECVEIYKVGETNQYHYKQVCQTPCHLNSTASEIIGCPEILKCEVIDPSTKACKVCSCDFSAHMQVYYTTRKKESEIVDNKVKIDFDLQEKRLRDIKELITKYDEENDGLEKEYNTIFQICTRFAEFLRRKVIVPFSDSYKEYAEYLILQEKSLGVTSNASKIQHWQTRIQEYEPVKQIFLSENNIKEEDILITHQHIHQILKELYDLKYHGSKMREIKIFTSKEYEATENDFEVSLHSNNEENVMKNINGNKFQQSRIYNGEFADVGKDQRNRSTSKTSSKANSQSELYSIGHRQDKDNLTDKFEHQNSGSDQFEGQHKPRSRMRDRGRGQWHNRYKNQWQTKPAARNRNRSEDETRDQSQGRRKSPLEIRDQRQAENSATDKFQSEDNKNELLKQPRSRSRMRGRGRGQWRNGYANHSQTGPGARNQSQTNNKRDQSQSQDRESDQQYQFLTELNPNFQGNRRGRGRGKILWQKTVGNQSIITTENSTQDQSQSLDEESNESQTRFGLRGRWQRRGTRGWVSRRGRNQFHPLGKNQVQVENQKESNIQNDGLELIRTGDSSQNYTKEAEKNSYDRRRNLQAYNESRVTNFNNSTQKYEYKLQRHTNHNFTTVNYNLSPRKTIDNQNCENVNKTETNQKIKLPQIRSIGQVQFDSKGQRYISESDLSPSLKTGNGWSHTPPRILATKKDELESIKSDSSHSYTREVRGNSERDLQKSNVNKVTNFDLTQKSPLIVNRENTPPRKTIYNGYHESIVKKETNHNFALTNPNLSSRKTVVQLQNHNRPQERVPTFKSTYNEIGKDANRYFERVKVRQSFVTNRVVSPTIHLKSQSYHRTPPKSEKCCIL